MDPAANWHRDHWQRIEELFHAALELETGARPAFLEQACGADTGLLKEVESLLEASEQAVGFPKSPLWKLAALRSLDTEPAGARVGAYSLIRVLGRGGMGTVYLASRADRTFEQQVAIKIMRPGFAPTEGMLLRFSAERQILANLNHANIARLLDGGMTREGIPYLVMEYVDGTRIDDYCRKNALPVDSRLELFRAVCSAVEYAHKNLVIHRDIKPANILVTAEGVPKLLDFGIAKLLDPQAGQSGLTRTGEHLMTPEYASPEQVRGGSITTASDVYSLGVLLYELLAGKCPFELHSKDLLQVAEIVCEQTPDPPSRAIAGNPEYSAPDAPRKVKGDLDNIVMMAMRKEASRRYTSAGALSHDVQAFLSGYSVMAHTDTWRYRTVKFVRRHKMAVSMGAAAIVALVGFSIGMGLLARRENQARRIADQQRRAAQRESTFLGSVFNAVSSDGNVTTTSELLDKSVKRVDAELADAPDIQAAALYDLGVAYSGLGLNAKAQPVLERAYTMRLKLPGASPLDLAKTADGLAHAYQELGNYPRADELFRQAVIRMQKAPGDNNALVSKMLSDLAYCLWLESRDSDSVAWFRKSLALNPNPDSMRLGNEGEEMVDRQEGPSFHLAMTRHIVANFIRDRGDLREAEHQERNNLILWRKFGGSHIDVIYAENNLGVILLEKGDWRQAEPLLQNALTARENQFGNRHPLVAISLLNMGRVLQAKGDYQGATSYFNKASEMLRETIGEENWSMESVLANFSLLELDRGEYAKAEDYAKQALEMTKHLNGDRTLEAAADLVDLGLACEFQSHTASAELRFRSAMEILKAILPPGYPAQVAVETRLGEALIAGGRAKLAEPILREAASTSFKPPFPLPPWQAAEAQSALAVCLERLGHQSEAQSLFHSSNALLSLEPDAALRRWVQKLRFAAPSRFGG